MSLPDTAVWLVAAYAVLLVVVAWVFDLVARRVSTRSSRWRDGEFVYLEDHDAWKCKEDQWLWPISFDPENRVMLYKAHPMVCNDCAFKQQCTTSDTGREIRREVDPWPHSEAGRFHRGISCAIAALAIVMPLLSLAVLHTPRDLFVLAATVVVAAGASVPLARHLWHTPSNFPAGVVEQTRQQSVNDEVDKYATKWGFDTVTEKESENL